MVLGWAQLKRQTFTFAFGCQKVIYVVFFSVADTALSSSNLSDVEGDEQPDGEVNLNRNATDDGNLSQQLQIFPFCDFVSLNVVKGCFVKEDMHWLHLFP